MTSSPALDPAFGYTVGTAGNLAPWTANAGGPEWSVNSALGEIQVGG